LHSILIEITLFCLFLQTILIIISGTVLSKEALDKMGVGIRQLSKEQEESKVYFTKSSADFNSKNNSYY
jgi:hypothetical protein